MAAYSRISLQYVFQRLKVTNYTFVNHEFYCKSFMNSHVIRTYCDKKAAPQWQLMSAVILERKPVITAEMVPIERDFKEMLEKIEFENSLLSDHELRVIDDIKKLERLKQGDAEQDEEVILQTAEDFEDACEEEFKQFVLAPRKTKADEMNDRRSIQRCLDSSLLFVVELKLGDDFTWVVPMGLRAEGESMRQAAERVLQEVCGTDVKARFMGNAPAGYYKYTYPQKARVNGIVGAKVFFFKAQLLDKSFKMEKTETVKDYAWLQQKEWQKIFHPAFSKSIRKFMINYEPIKFQYPEALNQAKPLEQERSKAQQN